MFITSLGVHLAAAVQHLANRKARLRHGQLTLLNKTSAPFKGPIYVVFTTLRRGVSIANATGVTKAGKPYLRIDRTLTPNKSVFALLKVRDRFRRPFDTFSEPRGS